MRPREPEHPVAQAATEVFRATSEGAAELPLTAHGLIFVALFVGIILWLVGGKFIKPAIATVGVVVGGAMGFLLLPILGVSTVLGLPGPYLGMAIGGILGLILAILLFRVSMIVAGGVTFGVAGLLGGAIYLQYMPSEFQPSSSETTQVQRDAQPGEGSKPPATGFAPDSLTGQEILEEAERRLGHAADAAGELLDQIGEDTQRVLRTVAQRAEKFAEGLWRQMSALWSELSTRDKQVVGLATLCGAAAGVLIGLLMPSKSAAMVTSMAGAAIWLASATWLVHAFEVPGRTILHRSPMGWAFIWIVFSILGLMFQFTRAKRSRSSAANDNGE
ncbi:MAG: hypothetical protein KF866_04825 [Phycisphaeraceae bacterium]|nr:hypothetical protein [Phycisphaeraceae bacterium]MCW5755533.1 hypothetical protein [Phycisphaeraceae bacterium]